MAERKAEYTRTRTAKRKAEREALVELAKTDPEAAEKLAEMRKYQSEATVRSYQKMRADAEAGACEGKLALAKRAKELGYDAIHDTVHEMAKDEARHGAGFKGLLKRYF